ncbi:glycogen synthase GlgA [Lignipirellula cremea]|uniref:Glycogen synthase n=1 Tax=Lignipirellula cremea TaxID=2528010 RepID=A0A518DPW9_9BACT|nr:glycogen synthase GlgA [Lignipirellula cremea]QDU93878.1 Glycogen synthase [Lignipirellula cremea]
MNILLASSEAAPFARTGGLGDVCGSLPSELAKLGHSAVLFLPGYRHALNCGECIETTEVVFDIPIGGKIVFGRLLKSTFPGTDTPVYFVHQPDYFDREGLYSEGKQDYRDNCERFVFFCRAVLESIRQLNLEIDVIHCNDWQTGLIPAYLNTDYAEARGYEKIASLFTIHNLEYQGLFWHWDMLLTGLDWKYFNWRQMEYFGQLNLLKTGLVFADAISTVSPRYAQEIQTYERGCGLQGLLQDRSNDLSGILNGVSYEVWNPETDEHLASNYTVDDWRTEKPKCKAALQEAMGLPVAHKPLLGAVGRLTRQKGWDLILEVMRRWLPSVDVQWVILGSGEDFYESQLRALAEEYPHKLAVQIDFSEPLSHQIEAGSDFFLMPSLYEPCGLNQIYSLKYGTPPVVRETGGLADTITDASAENLAAGVANGFSFQEFSSDALEQTLRRACNLYRDQSDDWTKLVETGMQQDWSWSRSAAKYVELYQQLVDRRRQ